MPEIIQVLFKSNNPNLLDKDLERKIFETRKKIENSANRLSLNNFYVCSMSSKSIIYKGMFLAEAISDFYLDLKDERFISRYAIFHQRFSTNTAPSWSLAQPFRAIAHNGETFSRRWWAGQKENTANKPRSLKVPYRPTRSRLGPRAALPPPEQDKTALLFRAAPSTLW